MSLLAPLYFLGALAVGLPILFHLIRRRPRDRNTFSSLMFLSPTPPRLTRRSRLENWPLLLLRALVIIMIAAAFSRPFLRSAAQTTTEEPEQMVMLVVDTSASMRRAGLWEQVGQEIDAVLETMTDQDRVGLITFDRTSRTLVFLEANPDAFAAVDHSVVRRAFREAEPTWFAGDLGGALTFAADALNEAVSEQHGGAAEKQLILISDMQSGAAIETLQGYDWPKDVGLDVRTVHVEKPTNVSAIVLHANEPADRDAATSTAARSFNDEPHRRVRVASAADSRSSQFTLRWTDRSGELVGEKPVATNVPPGEVRIVRMEPPPEEAVALQLEGDEHPFDNTVYVASEKPRSRQLLYLGDAPDDPRESLSYYLERASLDTRRQQISFAAVDAESLPEELDPADIALIVVAPPFTTSDSESGGADGLPEKLHQFVERGGVALVVLAQPLENAANSERFLRQFSQDASLRISEADVSDYAMFSAIDFRDPLFSLFADPRFSDFTKIRFWQHRQLQEWDQENWKVVAEFDDRSPAILQTSIGDGRLWVLAAGWQPSQSQLALSTKFVPLLSRWIDPGAGEVTRKRSLFVGDSLAALRTDENHLVLPDGTVRQWDDREGEVLAAEPGIYQIVDDQMTNRLAVNLDPAESETAVMEPAELERFGISLGKPLDRQRARETERQLRNIELERQQSWWRWLILSAVGLLAIETWWAGRLVGAASKPRQTERDPSSGAEANQ